MSVITRAILACVLALFLLPATTQALLVTPSAIDFTLDQTQEGSVEVIIANNGKVDAAYELDLLSVTLGEDQQIVEIDALSSAEERWFELSDTDLSLAPEEAQIITLSVNPADSTGKGLYIFGLQVTERAQNSTGIAANSGVLSLIFITVGEPEAKAELLDFSVDHEQFHHLPVNFAVTIRNQGERLVQPSGSIQIYNAFGTIVRQLPVNVDGKRILSGEDRTLMVQWGSGEGPESFAQKLYVQASQFAFGPFTAELTVTPWEGADPLTQQVSLFAFPWQLLSLLGGLVLIIVIFARFKR